MTRGGVVIDCDGTLVDTESLWALAERATVEAAGGRWSAELAASFRGRPPSDVARVISAAADARGDRLAFERALVDTYGRLLAAGPVAAMPGAEQLLAALAARRIPTAVASNTASPQVDLALTAAGLRGRVLVVACAGGTVGPKPAPDVYVTACAQLGVDPARSVAIEDTQVGLDAAGAAGLLTVAVGAGREALAADLAVDALWPLDLDYLMRAAASR